jgi:hypothetical protein
MSHPSRLSAQRAFPEDLANKKYTLRLQIDQNSFWTKQITTLEQWMHGK